jgi:heme/copper-type cytochrome/quinol oxidase subunit 3
MSIPVSSTGTIGATDQPVATPPRVRTVDERLTLVAVRMLILAGTFGFAAWFFAQAFLQIVNENNKWLPVTLQRPLAAGTLQIIVMVASWLVYLWAQYGALRSGNFRWLNRALWLSGVLGLIALGIQVNILHNPGFTLQDGGYASVFVGMEGVITALLLFSLIVLFGLANRARLGLFQETGVAIEGFGEWWMWLTGISAFAYANLYVVPFLHLAN